MGKIHRLQNPLEENGTFTPADLLHFQNGDGSIQHAMFSNKAMEENSTD